MENHFFSGDSDYFGDPCDSVGSDEFGDSFVCVSLCAVQSSVFHVLQK